MNRAKKSIVYCFEHIDVINGDHWISLNPSFSDLCCLLSDWFDKGQYFVYRGYLNSEGLYFSESLVARSADYD